VSNKNPKKWQGLLRIFVDFEWMIIWDKEEKWKKRGGMAIFFDCYCV